MSRHVALLRGINVGGHRVKMDRLRALFSEMGFGDVSTFIASGNVIFSSDGEAQTLGARIERVLEEALGYPVRTFLRTPAELEQVVAFEPPGHTEDRALYVLFLDAPADDAMRERFAAVSSEADRFTFEGREIYWSIRGKLSESPLFGAGIDRATGDVATTSRNITSLRRLVAKLGG